MRGLCFVSRSDYHHLYNTAAWKRARSAQLSAHPLCRMDLELGRTVPLTFFGTTQRFEDAGMEDAHA